MQKGRNIGTFFLGWGKTKYLAITVVLSLKIALERLEIFIEYMLCSKFNYYALTGLWTFYLALITDDMHLFLFYES